MLNVSVKQKLTLIYSYICSHFINIYQWVMVDFVNNCFGVGIAGANDFTVML